MEPGRETLILEEVDMKVDRDKSRGTCVQFQLFWCGMVFVNASSCFVRSCLWTLVSLHVSSALERKDEGTLRASFRDTWNSVRSSMQDRGGYMLLASRCDK